MNMRFHLVFLAFIGLISSGCGGSTGADSGAAGSPTQALTAQSVQTTPNSNPSANATTATVAGDPVAGLDAELTAKFQEGRAAFVEDESADPTFGPLFNGRSCVECHSQPAVGGGSAITVTRFGRTEAGVFDPLSALGGSLLQVFSTEPNRREVVPLQANTRSRRRTTSLLGAGLIEAIPDSAILDYAALQAAQNPQQAGQVHRVTSLSDGLERVGRFGWKSQHALLLDFAGDAYQNEMGISNPVAPFENTPNGPAAPVAPGQLDDQPDANGITDVVRLTNFMRLLAPAPTAADHPGGRQTFHTIGCAVCHHPSFPTISTIPALHGKTVNAYSDFLLHDVASGDGIVQGQAPANKLRTAPLMGVRTQPALLHDGSAPTVTAAILAHGAEAASARQAFEALTESQRQQLVDFVNSL